MQAKLKTLRRVLIGIAAPYLFLSCVGAFVLTEASVHLQRRPVEAPSANLPLLRASIQNVSIYASDGAFLSGWYAQAQHSHGDVILLHGITDNRMGISGYAEMFLAAGYTVLLPDSRGHGNSGGQPSYGLHEREDVHRWVNWLEQRDHPACVYGFGESMGAGILMQSLAIEKRFCAAVAESGFSDFREAMFDRVSHALSVPRAFVTTVLRPTIELGFLYARFRYGLDFSKASPIKAVESSPVPLLLVHGMRDVNLRPEQSMRIYKLRPANTELWLVPGAAHCGASSAEPLEFKRRVLGWFEEHSDHHN